MSRALPRVVTLGGGHGQATLLTALRQLECEITAVISVADDGGCSGKLRQEYGMPPPGDVRRCLSALAKTPELARSFELRLEEPGYEGRSAGNLELAAAFRDMGSLQQAVDWAAERLSCVGRVVPVSESPGVLVIYDRELGRVEGESNVERRDATPMVAAVHGAVRANPVAVEAIARADLLLMGPGSFYTSTLGAVTTGEVAVAICNARAEKVLIGNLAAEGRQTQGLLDVDYLRVLGDHLTIASGGERAEVGMLLHRAPCPGDWDGPSAGGDEHSAGDAERELREGPELFSAPLCEAGAEAHDPDLLALALSRFFGLKFRAALRDRAPVSA